MLTITTEQVHRTVAILGEGDRRDTEIEIAVARFAPDRMTVHRLIDWIPEAFGIVLLPHVADVILPTTFSAQASDGTWKEFAFEREPIFAEAVRIAMEMYDGGPRSAFSHIAKRSAVIDSVNTALNAGKSLAGAKVSGPALLGIPAELYEDPKPKATSYWRKLIG